MSNFVRTANQTFYDLAHGQALYSLVRTTTTTTTTTTSTTSTTTTITTTTTTSTTATTTTTTMTIWATNTTTGQPATTSTSTTTTTSTAATNCAGNALGSDLYWHAGRGGCSICAGVPDHHWHFGLSRDSDVYANCTTNVDGGPGGKKWGHFHPHPSADNGVYVFGDTCASTEQYGISIYSMYAMFGTTTTTTTTPFPTTTTTTTTTSTTTITTTTTALPTACGNGHVRVVRYLGNALGEGLPMSPEVFYQGAWYPICGTCFWDAQTADTQNAQIKTFCQKLGYAGGDAPLRTRMGIQTRAGMPVGACHDEDTADTTWITECAGASCGASTWCRAGTAVGVVVICRGAEYYNMSSSNVSGGGLLQQGTNYSSNSTFFREASCEDASASTQSTRQANGLPCSSSASEDTCPRIRNELVDSTYFLLANRPARGFYRNNERAELLLDGPGELYFAFLSTEKDHDRLEVGGISYHGEEVPPTNPVVLGTGLHTLVWSSDFITTGAGWALRWTPTSPLCVGMVCEAIRFQTGGDHQQSTSIIEYAASSSSSRRLVHQRSLLLSSRVFLTKIPGEEQQDVAKGAELGRKAKSRTLRRGLSTSAKVCSAGGEEARIVLVGPGTLLFQHFDLAGDASLVVQGVPVLSSGASALAPVALPSGTHNVSWACAPGGLSSWVLHFTRAVYNMCPDGLVRGRLQPVG